MISDSQTIIDLVRGIGAIPILLTAAPRNSLTTAKRAALAEWNEWIKTQADQGVYVADVAAAVTDPSTGDWIAAYTTDNIHQSAAGALAMAKALAALLERLVIPMGNAFPSSPTDPKQIVVNPWLAGAPGTTVPSGWVWTGSAARSVVARTDGMPGNWVQQIASAAGSQFFSTPVLALPASVIPGATAVEILTEFASDAWTSATIVESHVEFYLADGTTIVGGVWPLRADAGGAGALPVGEPFQPGISAPCILRSPRYTIPANAVMYRVINKFDGVGTIRWGRQAVRIVD